MGRKLLIVGAMSSAGKSLICAGLCRIFREDGLRPAPFKAQNMALNSAVTADGRELSRSQYVQAQAAEAEPDARMNPILLKPMGDSRSQVVLCGREWGTLSAAEYYAQKRRFEPVIARCLQELSQRYDPIVMEGAGGAAEINLYEKDLSNLYLARLTGAPALLVGDIDRGGVFAQLYGTMMLLPPEDRRRITGLIINKFRGDPAILQPGIRQLEEICGVPVLGVVPYVRHGVEEEDSLAPCLDNRAAGPGVDVAVIRLPRLANFTDFAALSRRAGVTVRYVTRPGQLERAPDLLILPGSKNTLGDLAWLRQTGLARRICALAGAGAPVLGICGGYQLLGRRVTDQAGAEGGGSAPGLGLLPVETDFVQEKRRTRTKGVFRVTGGFFSCLDGAAFSGYELHMGRTRRTSGAPLAALAGGGEDGCVQGNVAGSYIHGLLDGAGALTQLCRALRQKRGLPPEPPEETAPPEPEGDAIAPVAAALRQSLDLPRIYRMMEEETT